MRILTDGGVDKPPKRTRSEQYRKKASRESRPCLISVEHEGPCAGVYNETVLGARNFVLVSGVSDNRGSEYCRVHLIVVSDSFVKITQGEALT